MSGKGGNTQGEEDPRKEGDWWEGDALRNSEVSVISGPHFVAQPREISYHGENTSDRTVR